MRSRLVTNKAKTFVSPFASSRPGLGFSASRQPATTAWCVAPNSALWSQRSFTDDRALTRKQRKELAQLDPVLTDWLFDFPFADSLFDVPFARELATETQKWKPSVDIHEGEKGRLTVALPSKRVERSNSLVPHKNRNHCHRRVARHEQGRHQGGG